MYVLPEVGLLTAPTVGDLQRASSGELIGGDTAALGLEAATFVVASMTLPNLLDRLTEGAIVITGGDRADVVLGALMAHASRTLPTLSRLILTGGLRPANQVRRLIEGLNSTLPILLTEHGTYSMAHLAGTTVGRITPQATRKIETALRVFDDHVDRSQVLDRITAAHPEARTPLMFEYELFDRARADRRHIVLPEGGEDRVLSAADVMLRRQVVDLTLLGDPAAVRARATQLQLDISAAAVIDPAADELHERFAQAYAARRAHKGVTLEIARDLRKPINDLSRGALVRDIVNTVAITAIQAQE